MVSLLLLGLVGCNSGYLDRNTACESDVFDWWGDVSWYVNRGDEGSFDFQPEPGYLDTISGTYDTQTGDLSFDISYANAYFLNRSQGSGFGTIFRNGDVDVLYTQAYEDILGATWQIQRREERWSCAGDISWYAVNDDGTAGSVLEVMAYSIASEDKVTYQRAADWEGSTWLEKGAYSSDFSRTYTWEAIDGTYFEEGLWGSNGGSESTWTSQGSDYDLVGDTNQLPSGGYTTNYDAYESGKDDVAYSYSWTYEYDGSGEGLYTDSDGGECDLEVTSSGTCTYDCDNGQSGSC